MQLPVIGAQLKQWRREGGKGVHPPRAALCKGPHLEGQKYGIWVGWASFLVATT